MASKRKSSQQLRDEFNDLSFIDKEVVLNSFGRFVMQIRHDGIDRNVQVSAFYNLFVVDGEYVEVIATLVQGYWQVQEITMLNFKQLDLYAEYIDIYV